MSDTIARPRVTQALRPSSNALAWRIEMRRRHPVDLLLIPVLLIGCSVARPGADESVSPSTAVVLASLSPSPVATPRLTDPPTPPPSASPEPLPADIDPELADAIRLRRGYGLRSDLDYVRMVAADPRASNWDYGHPLYPEEFADAQTRYAASDAVATIVRGYAQDHADVFGGMYIDEATHAGVVSLWTDDLAVHAAAIRDLVGPDARVAFGSVRYPETELRSLQDLVDDEWNADWVAAIPAAITRVGVDIRASQVVVSISSAEPDAVRIVKDHFDLGPQLRVESDGTGARLLPYATVKGRLRPAIEATALILSSTSDEPGSCGSGDMAIGIDDHGRFEMPCQVGRRTIIALRYDSTQDKYVEVGRATVDVTTDAPVSVIIDVSAP